MFLENKNKNDVTELDFLLQKKIKMFPIIQVKDVY